MQSTGDSNTSVVDDRPDRARTPVTPAERIRELATDPYIRDIETRASLEFHRSAHENSSGWWALAKHTYLVYPSNPSEEELRKASENPAETMDATAGEMAATAFATAMIVANVNVAMFSIQGANLESFIQECIRTYTDKAFRLLRPASADEASRSRVAHLIDLHTTTELASIRMISHAQAALKDGLSWDEVKQMLPGNPAAETDAGSEPAAETEGEASQQDQQADMDDPSRSSKLVAYLHEIMEGGPNAPTRPDISCLGEASLLRIEAAVLEIVAKARDTILADFATMLPTEEHITTYEEALNSGADTAAKGLTELMFRVYLGMPIFEVVAAECMETVARSDLPLCLEAAAQFALAHMPPDEYFVPQLRLKEFKLYLAKALRRDAERVGSRVSDGAPTKSDGAQHEARGTDTASSDTGGLSKRSQVEVAAARQKIVNPILAAKRWTRGKWVTESGVGKNCIYQYLDGKRTPGTENRQAMADALGLRLEDLPE